METFDQEAASLEADPRHAKILLEFDAEEGGIEKIYRILGEAGVQTLQCITTRSGKPFRILIHLTSMDMRNAARRLSEAGFSRVKGINAAALQARGNRHNPGGA
ncbi:MAG: hypothetical protein C4576_10515 [Desulfobacteraceae bacterium]|nr:MAG: hypothetical protein C4576_10515 [Desulfobacteraceae bacterium]